jgi:hypothetical protein
MGAEILLYLSCEIFLKDKGKIQKKWKKKINKKNKIPKKVKTKMKKCSFSLL